MAMLPRQSSSGHTHFYMSGAPFDGPGGGGGGGDSRSNLHAPLSTGPSHEDAGLAEAGAGNQSGGGQSGGSQSMGSSGYVVGGMSAISHAASGSAGAQQGIGHALRHTSSMMHDPSAAHISEVLDGAHPPVNKEGGVVAFRGGGGWRPSLPAGLHTLSGGTKKEKRGSHVPVHRRVPHVRAPLTSSSTSSAAASDAPTMVSLPAHVNRARCLPLSQVPMQ